MTGIISKCLPRYRNMQQWFRHETHVLVVVVYYNVATIVTTKEEIMQTIGVRELKERISEMLRLVQEKGEIIEVTNRGEVVALLVPAHKPQQHAEQPTGAIWTDFDRLAAE